MAVYHESSSVRFVRKQAKLIEADKRKLCHIDSAVLVDIPHLQESVEILETEDRCRSS